MAFNDTVAQLGSLLTKLSSDLGKIHKGNKSAAQRIRVNTLDLEKVGKQFRKESLNVEKNGRIKKKSLAKKKKTLKKTPRRRSFRSGRKTSA